MKSNKTLLDELNNKLEKEYNEFIQEIIKLDPLSIINKTYEEIASEENCSKVAVKYSIDIALEKISKKIKI